MKRLILTILCLTGFEIAAHACDSLIVRREGGQVACYRFEKRLSLDEVKKRYERYKPDAVVLNVQDTVGETEARRIADVIRKEGIKEVLIAKPEKK